MKNSDDKPAAWKSSSNATTRFGPLGKRVQQTRKHLESSSQHNRSGTAGKHKVSGHVSIVFSWFLLIDLLKTCPDTLCFPAVPNQLCCELEPTWIWVCWTRCPRRPNRVETLDDDFQTGGLSSLFFITLDRFSDSGSDLHALRPPAPSSKYSKTRRTKQKKVCPNRLETYRDMGFWSCRSGEKKFEVSGYFW